MADSDTITLLKQQLADRERELKALEKQVKGLETKAALAEQLGTKVSELEQQAKELETQHAQALEGLKSEHSADMVFTARGITAPEWRASFRSAFDKQRGEDGKQGEQDLGAWLEAAIADPDKAEVGPIIKAGISTLGLRPADTQAGAGDRGGQGAAQPPAGSRLPHLPQGSPTGRPPPAGSRQYDTDQAVQEAFTTPERFAALQQERPDLLGGLPNPFQPMSFDG